MLSPLSSHKRFIAHIVLDNFIDYFHFIDSCNKPLNQIESYKQLRLFINAIESANNIPEYFFHDVKDKYNWKKEDLRNVLGGIRKKHKILRDIEQISNAYKHCVRNNKSDLQADDLESSSMFIHIVDGNMKIQYKYESIACEDIINKAFKFWYEYHNNSDETILAP